MTLPSPTTNRTSPVVLRPATDADAAAIADVYLRSRNELVTCAPLRHTPAEVLEWITELLVPSGEVVVATHDGVIVGLSASSAAYGVVWLDQIYVDPRHIGTGIGAALLNDVIARAQTVVQLYTFAENARARAFYERHGFVVVSEGDGSSNEEGCPDVLYRRAQV